MFRVQNDSFPKSLNNTNKEITDKKSIAERFNSFFINNVQIWQLKYHIVQPILKQIFQISLPFFEKKSLTLKRLGVNLSPPVVFSIIYLLERG